MQEDPVGVAAGNRATDPPDGRRWKALAVLGTAFFMVILDSTIVLTAIPSMQQQLNLSISGVQWVLTGYAVAFGGLMLFFGRVGDFVGRRRIFLSGVVLFVLASAFCGAAWSSEVLVTARALQGISAAIMAPTALAIVIATFRDPVERNRALGIWGALGGVGATAGLLIGGVITSAIGWQWIFFINIPVGLGIFVGVLAVVPADRLRVRGRQFDAGGALTITAAMTLLVYAVVDAPVAGWASPVTLIRLAVVVLLVGAFVIIEARSKTPLVPLRIFRTRSVTAGNLLILSLGLTVDGMLFPLTLYAQQVLGYSALQFGATSAVMTVMSVVGAFAGQAAVTRFGVRPVAVAGVLLIAVGATLLVSVSVDGTFFGNLFWALLIFGPGMGAAFVASQIAALQDVDEKDSGLAAGLVDSSFNIGGALGIAVGTSVAISVERASDAAKPLTAFTEGLQAAFLTAALFAGVGVIAALCLPGRRGVLK